MEKWKSKLDITFTGACMDVNTSLSVSNIAGMGNKLQWRQIRLHYIQVWAYFPYFYNGKNLLRIAYPAEFVYNIRRPERSNINNCSIKTSHKSVNYLLFSHLYFKSSIKKNGFHNFVYKDRLHLVGDKYTLSNLSWNDISDICTEANGSTPFLYFSESELQNISDTVFQTFHEWAPVIVYTGYQTKRWVSTLSSKITFIVMAFSNDKRTGGH